MQRNNGNNNHIKIKVIFKNRSFLTWKKRSDQTNFLKFYQVHPHLVFPFFTLFPMALKTEKVSPGHWDKGVNELYFSHSYLNITKF